MSGYRIDTGVPFLRNDAGQIVGYIDDNGVERDFAGGAGAPSTPNLATVDIDPLTGGVVFSAGTTSVPAITNITFANLLANFPAADHSGRIFRLTDLGNTLFESTGTRWRPVNRTALVGSLDTEQAMRGTAETILYQMLFPAGVIKDGDRLRLRMTGGKSGTSETATFNVRFGAAGTVADTALQTFSILTPTNISTGILTDFKRISATSIRKMGQGSQATSYTGPSTGVVLAATTVSSMDGNPMYLTLTNTMSSTVESFTLHDVQVEIASANS